MVDSSLGTVPATSATEASGQPMEPGNIAVLAAQDDDHTWELLGDACDLAARLKVRVAALTFCRQHAQELIHHGADDVTHVELEDADALQLEQPFCAINTRLAAIEQWCRRVQPRILFVAATGDGRQLAARLAVRCEMELISPTLCVRSRGDQLDVTALHCDGRRARQVNLHANQSAILVLNRNVAQARLADASRTGSIQHLTVAAEPESIEAARLVAADPTVSDIQHLPRLIAGGSGLGSREGFELLRTVASRLDAGIAASRMAVDLGWIERERQVGQSGKTVRPELYIACGISGASHHVEGMSQSRHVVVINIDPQAPIFRLAHLGLVADWNQTLAKLDSMLASTSP